MTRRFAWGFAWAALAAVGLTGCGGGSGGGTGPLGTGGWDGTKACDTLKQADVEAITEQKSKPGRLDGVHPAGDGGAAVSVCYYELADGRTVSLLTRVSSGEELAAAVNAIKNPPPDMAMGKLDDVPGVGKAALWNDSTKQFHVWLDGDHYGIITTSRGDYTKQPDLSEAREQSIELARKIGG